MGLKTFERHGYPFVLSFNRIQTPIASLYFGIYRKDIYIWTLLIEIQVIKNWRPVAQPKKAIALLKEREEIVFAAQCRALYPDVRTDNVPF